jgi:hypothetical protein
MVIDIKQQHALLLLLLTKNINAEPPPTRVGVAMGSIFTPWRPCLNTSHAALTRPLRFSVSKRAFGNNASEPDEEELKKARQWLKTFSASTIPRDIGIMTYSRSSGPGGQNVNKYVDATFIQINEF